MADIIHFGKYVLLKKIASGGMGEVFLAKQKGPEGFEKYVVIKRILSHHTDNPDYVSMFFAEARVAGKMAHSNIVQIFEMGEIFGNYYIAMEFVNGKSMNDIIEAAKSQNITIPPAHIAESVARLCSGLHYAHTQTTDAEGANINLIHRDINPHNVLISYGGDVKIIDFGIAKTELNSHRTETGTIKGKFVYMSPEQSAAEDIDCRSDIFSVGIVLYEMLVGSNPFQKSNIVLSLDAIQRFDPPAPSTFNPDLKPFDHIIAKALAKKPDERYQSCQEMEEDLRRELFSGAIARAPMSLNAFLTQLFDANIASEKEELKERERTLKTMLMDDTSVSQLSKTQVAAPLVNVTEPEGHPGRRNLLIYAGLTMLILGSSIAAVFMVLGGRGDRRDEQKINVIENKPQSPSPEAPKLPTVNNQALTQKAQKEFIAAVQKEFNQPIAEAPAKLPADAPNPEPRNKPTPSPDPGKKAPVSEPAPASALPTGRFLVRIMLSNGESVGAGIKSVTVKAATGGFSINDEKSPFRVMLQYRFQGNGSIQLQISSEPWALLKRGGESLGKTTALPWLTMSEGNKERFEFFNPAVSDTLVIIVRFIPDKAG